MSEQYGWKFILDGTTDITDKIKSFTIESSLDSYCRELSFETSDLAFYDSLDFSRIPEEPRIEVFTRILEEDEYDEYETYWLSQGLFYIERPTFQIGVQETNTGIWGRQSTAVLGEPFAQKVTKLWETTTTFYALCQEILESVGLVWDSSRCDIQDFAIYADNFETDDVYPIEALRSLVTLIVGAEGFITSDRLGYIWIRRLDRSPETSDYDLTDSIVQSISEEPEWPEFGNRIKIIPSESVSQNQIEIFMDSECISSGGSTFINVYAQVRNGDGVPINNEVVDWSFDPPYPANLWYRYPWTPADMEKYASQNTGQILISNEMKRSDGFTKVQTEFEADSVIGIWAYSDKTRTTNFVTGGYEIDGKNILLTGASFTYCDQMVFVSYYASGMVKNTIVYSEESYEYPEAVLDYAEMLVIASVSGREDSKDLYVDNSCKCKSSLTVTANPSSVVVGGSATIEAFVENGGFPVSGLVRMSELSGKGTLNWSSLATGVIAVLGEKTEAINAIAGQTQCVLSSTISSVTGVWIADADGNKTGSSLYDSFNGRTIDLTTYVSNGTALIVDYNRAGTVKNYLRGTVAGVSRIDVSLDVDTEEGLSQTVQVTVTAPVYQPPPPIITPIITPPSPPASVTYSVVGPAQWNLRTQGQFVGSYDLKGSDGSYANGSTVVVVSGNGYFKLPGSTIVLDQYGRNVIVSPNQFWAAFYTTYQAQSVEVTVQAGGARASMITVIVS